MPASRRRLDFLTFSQKSRGLDDEDQHHEESGLYKRYSLGKKEPGRTDATREGGDAGEKAERHEDVVAMLEEDRPVGDAVEQAPRARYGLGYGRCCHATIVSQGRPAFSRAAPRCGYGFA